jgi:YggT family protein
MIRVLLSWISYNQYNQYIKILFQITDTILEPIREAIPSQMGGVDFSPMIAFILLGFLKSFLLTII